MSLVDALIVLDPWKDPRDFHIALRTDQQSGSGTADDPFNGATRLGPALSAAVTFHPLDVLVVTRQEHGFSSSVTIANVSGESAADFNKAFSGANFEVINPFAFRLRLSQANPPKTPPLPPSNPTLKLTATSGTKSITGIQLIWPVFRLQGETSHFTQSQVLGISSGPALFTGDFVVMTHGAGDAWCLLTRLVPQSLAEISGSCLCAPLIYPLDEVLRDAPSHSVIHLGPGVFETRGDAPYYRFRPDQPRSGFSVKPAMKLRGAGRDLTVLKLVQAVESQDQTYVFRSAEGELAGGSFCEVVDLTVDCNLGGQPIPGGIGVAPVTCAAVFLSGDHTRLRRLRAINWGCQAPPECFVLNQFGGANNVAEDCVVERPGENNTHETSMLNVVGDSDRATARGGVARHNYLCSEYVNGFGHHPLRVKSVVRDTTDMTLAHLETWEPHTHVKWKNLVVRGVRLDGSLANPYNGIFAIVDDPSDSPAKLSYRMYVNAGTNAPDISKASIGHAVSSEFVAIASVGDYELGPSPPRSPSVTFTTLRPHGRVQGQIVILANINKLVGSISVPTEFVISHGAYHRILSVGPGGSLQPTEFTIPLPPPLTAPQAAIRLTVPTAFLGNDYHGPFVFGGTGMITEGNSVYDLRVAHYTDTGITRDATLRDNYWSNVTFGCHQIQNRVGLARNGAGPTLEGADIQGSLARNNEVVTFTAPSAHGLVTLDFVVISGVTGADQLLYNGLFQITRLSDTEFSYEIQGTPIEVTPPGAVARKVTAAGSLTHIGNVATFTVQVPHTHNFNDLDFIRISGVTGPNTGAYNGLFQITVESQNPNEFSYTMLKEPTANAPAGAYALKQIGSCLTRDGTIALFKTSVEAPHGLLVGDALQINGAFVNGNPANPFNSTFAVKSVLSLTEFTVELRAEPAGIALGQPTYAPRHQTRRFALENNLIEVRPANDEVAFDPGGVSLGVESLLGVEMGEPAAFLYPQLLIRENVIRHVDNGSDTRPAPNTSGITCQTAHGALIEENVMENKRVHEGGDLRLEVLSSRDVHAFRNRDVSGDLIRGYNTKTREYSEQLEDRVELGLVLALF